MRPVVTTIVAGRGGGQALARTLDALAKQRRVSDQLVVALEPGAAVPPVPPSLAARLVEVPAGTDLDGIVEVATRGEQLTPEQWLWFVPAGILPEPGALDALLADAERSPSVAITVPKLVDADGVFVEYGRTLTPGGRTVRLAAGELDQSQYDRDTDVLGAAMAGLAIRRGLWEHLHGTDPGLHGVDDGLDLGVRARLAGARAVRVPDAVAVVDGRFSATELAKRRAELHRRIVAAPAVLVPFHWIALLPIALLRSLWHVLTKHVVAIPGELAAAGLVAVSVADIGRARRSVNRIRRLPWSALDPLRISREDEARRRSIDRELRSTRVWGGERPSFLTGGGLFAVLVAGAVGAVAFGPLIGRGAVVGGAALPLGDIGGLWAATGFTGTLPVGVAPDPFSLVLALLGSITWWQPSLAVIGLLLVALPLSAWGAWLLIARLTERPVARTVGAIVASLAPAGLAAGVDGRLGAVVAHVALPWLLLAARGAKRSTSAAATASLLAAVIVAAAPALAPALVVLFVAAAATGGGWRLALVPIAPVGLALPLIVHQIAAGRPEALLAEPGAPTLFAPAEAWQLALGMPEAGLGGWESWVGSGATAAIVLAVAFAPAALAVLVGLFLRGSGRIAWALGIALTGFAAALLLSRLGVVAVGPDTVPLWIGPNLSLAWLGAGIATGLAVDRMRGSVLPLVQAAGALVVVAPLAAATLTGQAPIAAGTSRVPAIVGAEAELGEVATIVLQPVDDGGVRVQRVIGDGGSLADVPTALATMPGGVEPGLAQLGADLVSGADQDIDDLLAAQGVQWVLLESPATAPTGFALPDADASRQADQRSASATIALDANAALSRVGESPQGVLWRVAQPADPDAVDASVPVAGDDALLLTIAGIAVLATAYLALPTGRGGRTRPRRRTARGGDVG